MMFVGLGGTGCRVGVELERRLRDELCGPDGMDLTKRFQGQNYLPYQLPACTQFVYVDLNGAELTRTRRRVVPTEREFPAAARTAHLVHDVVPKFDSYPEVARSLRAAAGDSVKDWLPPREQEPQITPLMRGAGQLPTVARAALFERVRHEHGVRPVIQGVVNAINAISNSGGELAALGGRLRRSCDVFVAFSVAGGTGSGIFYDYLHLIGDACARKGFRARIYPLVVMPSAFNEGQGGGRRARLNAGSSLLDLFRLIDDQNAPAARTQLDETGVVGELGVRYPVDGEVRLRTGSVQTGFLFSMPPGIERDDLHRSIASLIISLAGTEPRAGADADGTGERGDSSFADDFINRAVEREVPAPSGIGNRGVSTAFVSSMTVPVEELADLISSRLLARAVTQMEDVPPGSAESNVDQIRRLFTTTNLEPLYTREPLPPPEARPATGASAILRSLANRLRAMEDNLASLEQRLTKIVPALAQEMDVRRGVHEGLSDVDPFRLRRAVVGLPGEVPLADKLGFAGILDDRRAQPRKPFEAMNEAPPQPRPVRDRLLRKAQWSDPAVQASIRDQDEWYLWRSQGLWHNAWADQMPRWEPRRTQLVRELREFCQIFVKHAEDDEERFARRASELYERRQGVFHVLPPQGAEAFYDMVVRRFVDDLVARRLLRPTDTEAGVVRRLIGPEGWQHAYALSWKAGRHQEALAWVRDELKRKVKEMFRDRDAAGRLGEQPLLPSLKEILAQAVNRPDGLDGRDSHVRQFRHMLADLVPGGFSPQGSGPLKVLVSYPADAKDPMLEAFLEEEINLPPEETVEPDYRNIDADSVAVVQIRTSMSISEVRELREVLHTWSDALRAEQPQDNLKWRQRLGYDFGYLATTEEHRVHILHRMLSLMWNGRIHVLEGDPASPRKIRIQLDGGTMTLPLAGYGRASSWPTLLGAYEQWVLGGDEQFRGQLAEQAMKAQPDDLANSPRSPHELYNLVVDMADDQLGLLEIMTPRLPEGSRNRADQLVAFWARTLPAALDRRFVGLAAPVAINLRDLRDLLDGQP
ncbi:tubulin-like doman-containing protein [Nonomuraea sp. NPDC000554]|uniref:tubulin-like doman-containing protein n=1 Tax=Nonomuraea sp. NPDC000554 TaxID=3154259 RepID=UPI003325632A